MTTTIAVCVVITATFMPGFESSTSHAWCAANGFVHTQAWVVGWMTCSVLTRPETVVGFVSPSKAAGIVRVWEMLGLLFSLNLIFKIPGTSLGREWGHLSASLSTGPVVGNFLEPLCSALHLSEATCPRSPIWEWRWPCRWQWWMQ